MRPGTIESMLLGSVWAAVFGLFFGIVWAMYDHSRDDYNESLRRSEKELLRAIEGHRQYENQLIDECVQWRTGAPPL